MTLAESIFNTLNADFAVIEANKELKAAEQARKNRPSPFSAEPQSTTGKEHV